MYRTRETRNHRPSQLWGRLWRGIWAHIAAPVTIVITVVVGSFLGQGLANGGSYEQPDIVCTWQNHGHVKPTTCLLQVQDSGTGRTYLKHFTRAKYLSYSHRQAIAVVWIRNAYTHPWTKFHGVRYGRVKVKLDRPIKWATIPSSSEPTTWHYDRVRFRLNGHWVSYQRGDGCDSLSHWTC